jgi:hypothetical protein
MANTPTDDLPLMSSDEGIVLCQPPRSDRGLLRSRFLGRARQLAIDHRARSADDDADEQAEQELAHVLPPMLMSPVRPPTPRSSTRTDARARRCSSAGGCASPHCREGLPSRSDDHDGSPVLFGQPRYRRRLGSRRRSSPFSSIRSKASLISWTHWSPEGALHAAVGRQGGMKPDGRLRGRKEDILRP